MIDPLPTRFPLGRRVQNMAKGRQGVVVRVQENYVCVAFDDGHRFVYDAEFFASHPTLVRLVSNLVAEAV